MVHNNFGMFYKRAIFTHDCNFGQFLLFYCNKNQIRLQPTELCSVLEGPVLWPHWYHFLPPVCRVVLGLRDPRLPHPRQTLLSLWRYLTKNITNKQKTYSTRSFKTYFDILHYRNHMLWIHMMAFVVLICLHWKKSPLHCIVNNHHSETFH